ncbi:MAG TPA: ferric reductase-like transmembrane domain-containing protein [Xanthobacteraceae bacterium]
MKLIWPWQDRQRRFSALKAAAFALMLVPAIRLAYQLGNGEFGIYPLWLGGLTYWSGVWATAILLMALAVTPALTILRWNGLIDVRRMIGVAALAYTIAHIIVYFALRFWNVAVIAKEMATSLSLIVATLSTLGLIALGLTSLDVAIARMGTKGWQRLHNAIYAIAALALLHVLVSRGTYPEQYLLSGMFFWLMTWRVLDRHGHGTDAKALAILAVVSCLFTALLEVAWIWARRGYAPSETLGNNFTLVYGIPPAWQILGLGLLTALAAAWQALRPAPARFDMRKVG